MRKSFFKFIEQAAAHDPSVYLVVGDLGFSYIESFKEKYPNQFINAGIAEQNMIGVAAGLAMMGKRVFVYSIIPFATMRCFEQIRNNICYQQLPVTIVGFGGGFSYSTLGVTHHALEDVSIMRSLPEMTIVNPGSVYEAEHLIRQVYEQRSPCYLRFSSIENSVPVQMFESKKLLLGKAFEVISGTDYCIATTGNSLDLGYQVCKCLIDEGLDVGLVSFHTIKPFDFEYFKAKKFKAVFSIEEHFLHGGMGEFLGCCFARDSRPDLCFHAFGVDDFYSHQTGTRAWLMEQAGLSGSSITRIIRQKIQEGKDTFCQVVCDL